ncbi:MAG: TIGR03943 family protein [Cyanobacteria bacterium J083]|nr:MAG: TIGR03943 family protein [Cyanobacteria bacterium J083]
MNAPVKKSFFVWQAIFPWLDVIALLIWGILLSKYFFAGQLKLLIHPNYHSLALVTGIVFLLLGGFKAKQLLSPSSNTNSLNAPEIEHKTLFPPKLSSFLLIITAIIGLVFSPTVLTSQTALARGVTEALPVTRNQPQLFRASSKPEERSLIEWIRTLNAYPEPDAYEGQAAKVSGFVVHLPQLPKNYFLISRFIITCCAVDAYPVGIPVKLEGVDRSTYPPDTWLKIEGTMIPETLPVAPQPNQPTNQPERQLVLKATKLEVIPTPKDPYGY